MPDESERWLEWSPSNVPHVKGRYTERVIDQVTGLPEPQRFEVVCQYVDAAGKPCGQAWKGDCSSGLVRRHVQAFAARHTHADPLAGPRIIRPGSLRSNGEDQ